jgi:DNA-directed RNA polymerase alpha subunit
MTQSASKTKEELFLEKVLLYRQKFNNFYKVRNVFEDHWVWGVKNSDIDFVLAKESASPNELATLFAIQSEIDSHKLLVLDQQKRKIQKEIRKLKYESRRYEVAFDSWSLRDSSQSNEDKSIEDMEIEKLPISVRARNALVSEGLYTVKELVEYNSIQLLKIPNLGKTSLKEIKLALESKNISMKEERL